MDLSSQDPPEDHIKTPEVKKIFLLTRAEIVGIFTILVGFIPIGVSLGIFNVDQTQKHAPDWIIGIAGVAFVLMGIALIGQQRFALRTNRFIGGSIMTLMTIIPAWIAIGPGERHCTATYMFTSGPASAMSCRIIFGIGALILIPFTIWGWWDVLHKLFHGQSNT